MRARTLPKPRRRGEQPRDRVALERPLEARDGTKIAATAARKLEPGLQQAVRVPRQETAAPRKRKYQRSAGREASREREAPATPSHDRRLPPDREHVGADRAERRDLSDQARDPEHPRDEHASHDERHVLAAHRQQVVEPGSTEPIAQLVGQAFLFAQDEPDEDRAPFSRETGCDRAGEPVMDPVGDSAYSASSSDRPPAPPRDDVDAAAAQQGALVEAVAGPRGRRNSTTLSMMAPCGGARPSGTSSNTASRSSSPRKRMTRGRAAGRAFGGPAR